MAYQAKQRDPIFDSETQAVIERRGKELIGLALIAVGFVLALMLGSYSPDDPSWMAATEAPIENTLGRFGAIGASLLTVLAGYSAWAIALIFVVWGARLAFHIGEERFTQRFMFAPIAIAICSIYASTLVPGAMWGHSFGLGGLFGDTLVGALLAGLPMKLATGLKAVSIISAALFIASMMFVLGVDRFELSKITRFLTLGVVVSYAAIMTLLGRSAKGVAHSAAQTARSIRDSHYEWVEDEEDEHASENSMVHQVESPDFSSPPALRTNLVKRAVLGGAHEAEVEPELLPEEAKPGLLSSLMRRATGNESALEPELVETGPFEGDVPDDAGERERVSEKIASVLKKRAHGGAAQEAERIEPPLARAVAKYRRGPDPMILNSIPEVIETDANFLTETTPASALMDVEPVLETQDSVINHFAPISQPAPQDEAARVYRTESSGFVTAAKKLVQHPVKKQIKPSTRAIQEAQPSLQFEEQRPKFELPPLSLLTNPSSVERHHLSDESLEENARMLETVLDDYGVKGEIISVRPGPVVTMYELEPAPGLKASRVIGLADDIARSMSALSARVSTVPGRSVIGIELPNEKREKVVLREIFAARDFGDANMRLPLALGKDIGGDPVVANLAKMPHLLIAGTTGSGKSVAINTMILSLLYRLTPEECRLIMIDPKMLELSVYDGIPHLLSPVVTDPKKAVVALKWVVGEMEERYRKMSKMGVRNIDGYNSRVEDSLKKGKMFERTVQTGFDDDTGEPIFESEEFAPEKLPYIVVVVDEMADLMMVAGKEIEACIQRLAQMARASGIHLIMATQRPSVDVITGTIKANFPTRISFQVTSKIDSRTILGEQGAEQLLGMGDMLHMAGGAKISRVHGPFVSDEEVEEIVTYLKSFGAPDYVGGVVEGPDEDKASDIDAVLGLNAGGNTNGEDALYDQAVAIVARDRKCSTSYIQRKLGIGYNKAARLVEQMEDEGLVSASNHVGKREILLPEHN